MGVLDPTLPPYDPLEWEKKPFPERAELVCRSWAMQGYGSPAAIYVVYLLKIVVLYVGGWLLWCSFTPGLGQLGTIGQWWLEPVAFQKAIVWSMAFEIIGLGCGSGPLTGRYLPPIGGFLHFLRPGTTKLPPWPALPLLGGHRRTALDALLYAALLGALGWTLSSPTPGVEQFAAIVGLLVVLGLADKTLFLAARAEHYWTTMICFVLAGPWIAGAKAVQLALWFWAGVSKLNHHFPAVVAVMNSNSPFTRFAWFRRLLYRNFPNPNPKAKAKAKHDAAPLDLRPSRTATIMGHFGTALEFAVPLILAFAPEGPWLITGLVLMLILHGYISSNVPMGVPLEWNVMVVYGGFALFWAHPEVSVLELGQAPLLAAILAVMLIGLPLLGNLVPSAVSFLLAMRYYAGNWAGSVWLLRGDSHRKLEQLKKSAGWVDDQLGRFYERPTIVALLSKVMAFRLMHLHGRLLPMLLPQAVEQIDDYQWVDGEIIAGLALGWNFGDGHLHDERLLAAIQEQCGFAPGELRCVFFESQPLGRSTMAWRIADAASGPIAAGEVKISELRARQPWGS
ncbi:MAG: DUF3556 domain-containing protein [Enhygromyxa sp.]